MSGSPPVYLDEVIPEVLPGGQMQRGRDDASDCECTGISLTFKEGDNTETVPSDQPIRVERDTKGIFTLTINTTGEGEDYIYDVRVYNEYNQTWGSLVFSFTAEQAGKVKDAKDRTLSSIRKKAERDRLRHAKIYEFEKRVVRGVIGKAACAEAEGLQFNLKLDPTGPAPIDGDLLRLEVFVNGAPCGAREIEVGDPDTERVESSADYPDVPSTVAQEALEELFKEIGLESYEAQEPCPKWRDEGKGIKCRGIRIKSKTEVRGWEWREHILKVREEIARLIDEGEVRPVKNGQFRVVWPPGKSIKFIKNWNNEDDPLEVVIGVRTGGFNVGDVEATIVDPEYQDCPRPRIAIALADSGQSESSPAGASATALAPWTCFALAMGGDGFSHWNLTPNDEKKFRTAGVLPKGTVKRPYSTLPKRGVGGQGGDARAVAGSAIAIGGNGGNGVSGGDAGEAKVVDAFYDCVPSEKDAKKGIAVGGTKAGVAAGGFGGFGCNGNGGRGGDATASAATEATDGVAPDDVPEGFFTHKYAFGGGGGYGIIAYSTAPGGGGRGGDGGTATILFGAPVSNLARDVYNAIGGYGGYGEREGGRGGDAEWIPEANGKKARGNAGPGGQGGAPGFVPTHGTRNPETTGNNTSDRLLIQPRIPQEGIQKLGVKNKYNCS